MRRVDLLVALGFALFAFLSQLSLCHSPDGFLGLSSDGANIAGFAAALDHPDLFERDPLLGNPDNFRFYLALHIPLIRTLAKATGDYGNAFVILVGPHILLQALGFYLLGIVVLRNRFWAVLFAVITLMLKWINLGTFWGAFDDAIPRVSYQALLPFLLAAAFHWRSKPAAWPWLMAASGALIYVHPVSAPGWGFALWVGIWLFLPKSWPLARRIKRMGLLGCVFMAVALPFLIHYLRSHAHGPTVDYETVYGIMVARFFPGFLDVGEAIADFAVTTKEVLALGVLGAATMLWIRREEREGLTLVFAWMAGLLAVSALVPLVEQTAARALRHTPVEIDLVRGIRYVIPLMMLFWVWPFAEVSGRVRRPEIVLAVGIVLTGWWVHRQPPKPALTTLENWWQGYFVREPDRHRALREALTAVNRLTPPGSLMLSTRAPTVVRFFSLRPVAYTWKDGGSLAYSNHEDLIRWYETAKECRRVHGLAREREAENDYTAAFDLYLGLCRQLGAEYLLHKLGDRAVYGGPVAGRTLYGKDGYYLVEVPPG